MPRHPEDVDPPALCVGCGKDGGEDDSPLECDKVRYTSSILYSFKYRHFKSATLHGIYNVLAHLLILSPTASGSALIVKMTPVHQ